jgi:hypothetical protein
VAPEATEYEPAVQPTQVVDAAPPVVPR